jgi:uncharacterized phiE125 gp8 family phage protein
MLYLRLDSTDEQTTVEALIAAARGAVEEATQLQLITATWELTLDGFPRNWSEPIELPRPPITAITSIAYTDENGAAQTLSASDYQVDAKSFPGRLVPAVDLEWPDTQADKLNAVTITYTAGYGAAGSSVPRPLRQAMLLLVSHWFENREAVVVGTIVTELPFAVKSLIAPFRVMTQR